MAVFAVVAAQHMDLRFARGPGPVMTGSAGRCYIGVIEPCRKPRAGAVTIVAGVAARKMGGRLADVVAPVVTAVTTPEGIGGVAKAREAPGVRNVALIAWRVGPGMVGGFYRGLNHGAL